MVVEILGRVTESMVIAEIKIDNVHVHTAFT